LRNNCKFIFSDISFLALVGLFSQFFPILLLFDNVEPICYNIDTTFTNVVYFF